MNENLEPTKSTVWILAINATLGARIFRYDPSEGELKFHQEFPNLEIHLPQPTPSPPPYETDSFLGDVSLGIDERVTHENNDQVILCGDEDTLDLLRPHLSHTAQTRVIGTINQDLFNVNESDLAPYIRDLLSQVSSWSSAA